MQNKWLLIPFFAFMAFLLSVIGLKQAVIKTEKIAQVTENATSVVVSERKRDTSRNDAFSLPGEHIEERMYVILTAIGAARAAARGDARAERVVEDFERFHIPCMTRGDRIVAMQDSAVYQHSVKVIFMTDEDIRIAGIQPPDDIWYDSDARELFIFSVPGMSDQLLGTIMLGHMMRWAEQNGL